MLSWIKSRLFRELSLVTIALIFISAGAISFLLYRTSVASLEREAYGRLQQMVSAYCNELNIEITNTMQITDSLAAIMKENFDAEQLETPGYMDGQITFFSPYVRAMAQEFSLAKTAYVYYNWKLDGNVHDLYYVDPDNNGQVSRQDQLPADYFSEGASDRGDKSWWFGALESAQGYWTAPYRWVFDDGSSTIFVSYTRAAYDGDRLIGVAGTDFNFENILSLMARIKVYDTGYPFLINNEKILLVHPEHEGSSLAELNEAPYSEIYQSFSQGGGVGGFKYRGSDGSPWYITYHQLRNGWTLGLAAPVSEITQSARRLGPWFFLIFAGAAPLIALAVLLITRKVTKPVLCLTEMVKQIEAGDYEPVVEPKLLKRLDELGVLGIAIRNLGVSLKTSIRAITQKNLQLEAEIKEKNEAKSSFNLVYEAFSAADSGLIVTDANLNILHANPAFIRLIGYSGETLGCPLDAVIGECFPDVQITTTGGPFHQQKIYKESSGGINQYLWLMMNRIEGKDGGYRFIGILEDRTEAIHQARSIEFLRDHDSQTGLLNKGAAMEMIRQHLNSQEGVSGISALISLNIDDFRLINEALGYECGDDVIREIAQRIKGIIGNGDILARASGDEFILFIRSVSPIQILEVLGKRLLHAADSPVICNGKEVFATVSAGIAVYPFDSQRADQLLTCSVAALNHAKANGKRSIQFYSQDLIEKAYERYELGNQMREGLERKEFFLVYQPMVTMPWGDVNEMEALIRWNHPEKGVLGPDRFISLSEASGFINPLGDWIIEEVCDFITRWDQRFEDPLKVAVNLSAVQLNDSGFSERVMAILKRKGVAGNRINMEITESTLITQNGGASDNLVSLKKLGMEILLDDFGTGFSSLAYLRDFNVDVLKIDRSFIKDYPENESGDIAKLLIGLGRGLGVRIIAEGVETMEQAVFLFNNGCRHFQGYLFARPETEETLMDKTMTTDHFRNFSKEVIMKAEKLKEHI